MAKKLGELMFVKLCKRLKKYIIKGEKMKKKVLSVLLCVAMSAVMLMGCGNKSADKNGDSRIKRH